MTIVEAFLPQRTARQSIDVSTGSAFREDERIDSDMPLQHARECDLLSVARCAHVHGTSCVAGAIKVLSARVAVVVSECCKDMYHAYLR